MCDDNYIMFKGKRNVVWGGLYTSATQRFFHEALPNLSRTIKASVQDAAVVVRISEEKYEAIQNYFVEQGQKRKDNQSEL